MADSSEVVEGKGEGYGSLGESEEERIGLQKSPNGGDGSRANQRSSTCGPETYAIERELVSGEVYGRQEIENRKIARICAFNAVVPAARPTPAARFEIETIAGRGNA